MQVTLQFGRTAGNWYCLGAGFLAGPLLIADRSSLLLRSSAERFNGRAELSGNGFARSQSSHF
jgi:hypothetical protein